MATTVTIGGTAATDVQVTSATELTAVVPAGTAGPADVTVTTSAGSDTLTDGFTYEAPAAPTLTSVDPAEGVDGTALTLTGTGFTGATRVMFGSAELADLVVVSDTQITVTASSDDWPSGLPAGQNQLTVETPGGVTSDLVYFTVLVAPTVESIDPTSGPEAGGTTITITGTNFEES